MKTSHQKWIKSYKRDDLPHWAKSYKPSLLAKKFIKVLEKNGFKKGRVLEIGCGNGRDSLFFAQKNFSAVGVDISPEAVAICKNRRKKLKINKTKVDFIVADVEKLPFKKETFVGAYSIGVLHTTYLKKSFKEISRVLKKDGIAVIHFWEKTVLFPSKKIIKNYSIEEVKEVLASLPFEVLSFESGVSKTKKGFDEEYGFHEHSAIILVLKRV